MICWGSNLYLEAGSDTADEIVTPIVATSLAGVVSLSAGAYHTCALRDDGTVWCWGMNSAGNLGVDPVLEQSSQPVQVTDLVEVRQLDCGGYHSCVVLMNGTVRCWGNNQYGQLGNGRIGVEESSWQPVDATGLADVVYVSAGVEHSCAVVGDAPGEGEVWCWGNNDLGALGDGTTTSSTVAVPVRNMLWATKVCAGGRHTCVLQSTGEVWCWGSGFSGELGNGSFDDSTLPVQVLNIEDAVDLSCMSSHTCALLSDGSVRCWGFGELGQLGNNTENNSNVPVAPFFQ